MLIDVFSHILPPKYLERLVAQFPGAIAPPLSAGRSSLFNVSDRLRVMNGFPGYVQVLTLAQPPLEALGGMHAISLARAANDEMADLVRRYPEQFIGFAAALPMHEPRAAVIELERSVRELNALGAQIFTNVGGIPLDDPRFEEVFAGVEELGRAIWLHPTRSPQVPDYPGEVSSKYGIFMAFGWPYETAACIVRLILGGVLNRHPNLRILLHHSGGMLPHFAGRIGKGVAPPLRPEDPLGAAESLNARVGRTIKDLYADTALNGYLPAVECGLAFFGTNRLVFGTDMPYDDENGVGYIRDTIANVEALDITPEQRRRIYEDNARHLFDLSRT